jgi:ferrous iron transport protein B
MINQNIIALIGNPNTGKTSVFNQLTGLNQQVGNYPGITVEKKLVSANYPMLKYIRFTWYVQSECQFH